MSTPKTKNASWLVVMVISLLSFGSFAFVYTAVTNNNILGLVSQANEGEDDKEDEDDKDEDEDENEYEDEKDDKEEALEKKAKEEAKKKAEYQRELLKKKSEYQREMLKKKSEYLQKMSGQGGSNLDDDENEEENEEEDESEDNDKKADLLEDNDKKADLLEDINEDIIEAEERIARAQAEGIDATKALATLAIAKQKAAAADQSLTTTSYDSLRSIAREVKKLAHFASHKDVKSSRDMAKDMDKVAKRITQTKGKIALLESLGGNSATFTTSLNNLQGEYDALKTKLMAGGQEQVDALSQIEPLERKVKVLKSSVESVIYALGGTDERYDDDYENEVEDIYEDLSDVAEIEGDEIGAEIMTIATAQKQSASKVGDSVENIDKRSRVLQALFGTKTEDVNKLESEIAANKARIEVLNQAAIKIEDQEVKDILQSQITSLEQENNKLETFVSGQKDRLSAFGWFFNLFGNE